MNIWDLQRDEVRCLIYKSAANTQEHKHEDAMNED